MNSKYIIILIALSTLWSCNTDVKTEHITDSADYNTYLDLAENKTLQHAESNKEFWSGKLEASPEQYPYISKVASSYSQLFAATGKIEYLREAENNLLEVNKRTNYNNCGALRSLAHNYISQHRFKEALELLEKAEELGEDLEDTQKMLFDVHMELGNDELAKSYLEKFENMSRFDYLIRLAKWSDHQGNLDAAIKYLEKAKDRAESSNQRGIKQWIYTNLADFYGHAGEIGKSYNHFLKALELDPNDAYAKKGIAWIVYSHEKNPQEALRILDSISQNYEAPDYYLLKAQIYEYMGDMDAKAEQLAIYKEKVKNQAYGDMYNAYNVLVYTQEKQNMDEAIAIAQGEVDERPTPHSYDLLAWAYYNKGEVDKAVEITDAHVYGHTYEPMALYHSAEIYKAAGKSEKAKELKNEIMESSYELGPLVGEKVNKI